MVVEVALTQDLLQEAVELEEQVDQYKEHLLIQKEVLVV
jgi:hypothetical protein